MGKPKDIRVSWFECRQNALEEDLISVFHRHGYVLEAESYEYGGRNLRFGQGEDDERKT